jgi:hypothetical protein
MVNQRKLALAQAGSLGRMWLSPHLGAILLQEINKNNHYLGMRK